MKYSWPMVVVLSLFFGFAINETARAGGGYVCGEECIACKKTKEANKPLIEKLNKIRAFVDEQAATCRLESQKFKGKQMAECDLVVPKDERNAVMKFVSPKKVEKVPKITHLELADICLNGQTAVKTCILRKYEFDCTVPVEKQATDPLETKIEPAARAK